MDLPSRDGGQRGVEHPDSLLVPQRRKLHDFRQVTELVLCVVQRLAPGGGYDDPDRQRQRGGEVIVELQPVHLGAVQPVEDEDNLAEQRRVREEPRKRAGNLT